MTQSDSKILATMPRSVVVAAFSAACLILGGCGSSGSLAMSDDPVATNPGNNGGGPDGAEDPAVAAINDITGNTSGVITSTGEFVSSVGGSIGELGSNGPLADTTASLGGVIESTGNAVSDLGQGVAAGLGQIGSEPDPIGTTLTSAQPVVGDLGQAVSSLGDTVSSLDTSAIGPLGGVIGTVGGVVSDVGQGVESASQPVGALIGGSTVQPITSAASELVTPVLVGAVGATQQIGDQTGLGAPANNLVTTIGGGVQDLGNGIGTHITPVAPVGDVVASVGSTVSAIGGAVDTGASGGAVSGLQGLVGGLGGSVLNNQGANSSGGLLGGVIGGL